MVAVRRCVDCVAAGITTNRKTPFPGPRCASHNRVKKFDRRSYNHEKHILATYQLTPEMYWAIYAAQGNVCAICRRATGARRKLSVDHDHSCCKGSISCGKCVRSLLCSTCNKHLGHIRDSVETAERIVSYLKNPPGREVLKNWTAQ